MIFRVGLFATIFFGMFFVLNLFFGKGRAPQNSQRNSWEGSDAFSLPVSGNEQLVHHKYFTLAYNETHEQAEWVAYSLTREQLTQPWVKRPDWYQEDSMVRTGSATWEDYRGSGFDRGHLVPAADRAFSAEAIRETFLMSNISPQSRHFNAGIWRELEELTRNWAKRNKKLYIVCGPVLSLPEKGVIGKTGVTVPAAFFKVILDLSEPELKGIAFVLPNEVSYRPLKDYAVSIDRTEELTGIDFFPQLMTSELEEELERSFDTDLWPFSQEKYEKRVNHWNKD